MKLARMLLAAVAVTSLAQSASAQFNPNATTSSDNFQVTSGGPFNPFGLYKGQLLASPGQPTVDILCVDFLHGIGLNNPATTAITRFDAGQAAFDTRTRFGYAKFDSYKKAAYLSNFFAGLTNPSLVQDLHNAIYHLLYAPQPAFRSGETFWTNLLANNAWQNIDLTSYFVLSDPTMVFQYDSKGNRIGNYATNGRQEFIMHTVPEPGSVLMLSTGLLSLVGLARLRRRRKSA